MGMKFSDRQKETLCDRVIPYMGMKNCYSDNHAFIILSYPLHGNEIVSCNNGKSSWWSYPLDVNEILSIGSLGNSIVSYPLYGNEIICP